MKPQVNPKQKPVAPKREAYKSPAYTWRVLTLRHSRRHYDARFDEKLCLCLVDREDHKIWHELELTEEENTIVMRQLEYGYALTNVLRDALTRPVQRYSVAPAQFRWELFKAETTCIFRRDYLTDEEESDGKPGPRYESLHRDQAGTLFLLNSRHLEDDELEPIYKLDVVSVYEAAAWLRLNGAEDLIRFETIPSQVKTIALPTEGAAA